MNENRYDIILDGQTVAKDVSEKLMPDFVKYIFDKYYEEKDLTVVVKRSTEKEKEEEDI